jgi:hypothetical protein
MYESVTALLKIFNGSDSDLEQRPKKLLKQKN